MSRSAVMTSWAALAAVICGSASESGMPKEQMKKACRDVTATEKQNADKAATTAPSNPPANH